MKFRTILATALLTAVTLLSSCKDGSVNTADPFDNPVIQTILARRSIRQFAPLPVGRDTLDLILKCGISAPNAMNAQNWELRVVDNPEWLAEITDVQIDVMKRLSDDPSRQEIKESNMFRGAPTVVFIGRRYGSYTDVDCGLLGENICIAATALGVGSICMAGPTSMMTRSPEFAPYLESLGFSKDYTLLYCIGLGYALEKPASRPRNVEVIKYVE